MNKWHEYEQLKAGLSAGKLTPDEYERAVKELVQKLRL